MQKINWGDVMNKTISVRMDENSYKFVNYIARQEDEDISKAIRDLLQRGRLMLAIQRYQNHEISLGKAAEVAGISISEMIELLARFGLKANLEKEEYIKSLENIRKIW